ncbi:hypothetical protein [Pseudomonas aeruginosa]|uniref:hypothetical protein n=1 Tax=Pseudomonas aeruginosa TaxID=287 RepID=UPI0029BFD5C8|nr:hypothetical protein [Pseudomonas aeruginosa]
MSHFEQFSQLLADPTFELSGTPLSQQLLLSSDGDLETFYAPFDHINTQARVTICGITPGYQQAIKALNEARKQLVAGASTEEAMQRAKETASFAGSMRKNLIATLDHIGLNQLLKIDSCEGLFSTHKHLVHYTSALRYPVFINGENYSGSPAMLSRASLRHQVETHLGQEIRVLDEHCIYVPLGPKVAEVLLQLQAQGLLKPEQVLDGLPHPSGANSERISYFLDRKARENLSSKTNAEALDKSKAQLKHKIAQLSQGLSR